MQAVTHAGMRRPNFIGLALLFTLATPALGGTATINIGPLLDSCPQFDRAYTQIRSDFEIRRNGIPVGDIFCAQPVSQLPISQYTDELIVVQGLRAVFYMQLGANHLPWAPGTLYDWMKSKMAGIDISDTAPGSSCCEQLDGKLLFILKAQDDFNRDFDRGWRGISANIDLYAHELRHLDGFPHVSCCAIPNGCDQTYDETNLSPYGIQWWLNANWLTGNLYVGFSCLDPNQVAEITDWHLSACNGTFRDRFCDNKPPLLTAPAMPGGECRMECGDVNGDGAVNIGDALVTAQYDVGLRTCGQSPFSHPEACDANGDGACNIGDALRMAQCDVGLIDCAFICGPFACSSTTTTTTTSGTTSSISTVPTTTVTSTTSTTFPTCSELLGHCGASSCSGACVAHQPDNALECVDNSTCQFPFPCSSDVDCAGGAACFSDGSGHTACCTSGCACTPASCLGGTTTTTLPSPCGGECASCGTCGAGVCVVAGGTSCGHVGSGDVCVDGHSCTAASCTADADCGAGTVCVVEGHGAHLCCSTCS